MNEKSKEPIVFQATLTREPDSSATFISVPFDIFKVFGMRGRVLVRGTLNGYSFRSSLFPYGGVHYLGVNRNLRESAGLKAGDVVNVEMAYDDGPRVITPPPDLEAALEANAQARKNWRKLSYSHQKEYVDAIEEARKPETRAARISKTILALTEVKRYN